MKIFNALSFLSTAHPVVVNLVYVYHDEVEHRRPVHDKKRRRYSNFFVLFLKLQKCGKKFGKQKMKTLDCGIKLFTVVINVATNVRLVWTRGH